MSDERPKAQPSMLHMVLVGVLIAAITTIGNYLAVTRELSVKVDNITAQLSGLTVTVNNTKETADNVKTTLDEGIRQSLAAQDKRITVTEDRVSKLTDAIYDLRVLANQLQVMVDNIRRASEQQPPRR